MNKKYRSKNSGQILVVILLIMVVGLTVGLALMGRTTTDIALTTKISDSSRAFNAAEAGIEKVLQPNYVAVYNSPVPVASGAYYTLSTPTDLGASGTYYSSSIVNVGEEFVVWLVGHNDTTGELDESTVYTGNSVILCYTDSTVRPALGVTIYYREGTEIKSSYVGYDTDASRRNTSGFINVSSVGSGVCPSGTTVYTLNTRIRFGTGVGNSDFRTSFAGKTIIALNIKPIYAAASMAVVPQAGNLPKQGKDIYSTGSVGEIIRKINVKVPYPAPWTNYVIYSTGPNTLTP